jgi:ribosomal protein S7
LLDTGTCFFDRTPPVEERARRRLGVIAREVPIKPVAAVRASRGSTRLFLVAATESHAGYLTERLAALTASPWAMELSVYWS